MAAITNLGVSLEQQRDQLRSLERGELIAQEITQQGAIHAVSFLLKNGCGEAQATEMLASLREYASVIRAEFARRGEQSLFDADQTEFN